MPWGYAAAAIGAALIASDATKSAAEMSANSAKNEFDLHKIQTGISQEQWQQYKDNVFPLLQKMQGEATTADRTPEEVALASNDVKNAYAASRRSMARTANLDPNSSATRTSAVLAPSYMDEAGKLSSAITTARRAERARVEDTNWGRQLQLVGAYQGLPQDAAANLSGASASLARAGAISQRDQQIASQNAGQLSYGLGYLGKAAANWMNTPSGSSQQDPYGYYYDSRDLGAYNFGGGTTSTGAYTGMDAPFRDGGAIRMRYRDGGGVIRGPGTGTSDSIPMRARPNSYILSADTVRAIGHKKVNDLIEKSGVRPGSGGDSYNGIPIRASNGEAEIPPETVKYYGEEFFNKLQQKYHRPVQSDGDAMANGGAIRKRGLPKQVEDAIFRSMPNRALGVRR